MGGHDHGPVNAPIPHVLPLRVYWGIFATLCLLTVITVAVAQVDLGPFNLPVALLIAVVKASCVCAIFMHLWFDNKQYLIVLLASLLFVAIFIVLTFSDLGTRDFVDPMKDNYVPRADAVQKYVEENPDDPAHIYLRPGMKNAKTDEDLRKTLIDPDAHGDAAGDHGDGAKDAESGEH